MEVLWWVSIRFAHQLCSAFCICSSTVYDRVNYCMLRSERAAWWRFLYKRKCGVQSVRLYFSSCWWAKENWYANLMDNLHIGAQTCTRAAFWRRNNILFIQVSVFSSIVYYEQLILFLSRTKQFWLNAVLINQQRVPFL